MMYHSVWGSEIQFNLSLITIPGHEISLSQDGIKKMSVIDACNQPETYRNKLLTDICPLRFPFFGMEQVTIP